MSHDFPDGPDYNPEPLDDDPWDMRPYAPEYNRPYPDECQWCQGGGRTAVYDPNDDAQTDSSPCRHCGGTGRITSSEATSDDLSDEDPETDA